MKILGVIMVSLLCIPHYALPYKNYELPAERRAKNIKFHPLSLTQSSILNPTTIHKLCSLSQFKDSMQPEVTLINSTNVETEYVQIIFTIVTQHHSHTAESSLYYAGNFHIDPASAITVKPQHIESKVSKFTHPIAVYPSAVNIIIDNSSAHIELPQSQGSIFTIVKENDQYSIKPASICSRRKNLTISKN
jgi:hypothetical protein